MNLAKNSIFILLALFIDGLQAAISWGIATIAAFPVTVAGGAGGCWAGSQIAGQLGCWVAGGFLGLLSVTPAGLVANGMVAQATVPLGIAIGFAVNVSLSVVLGWAFLVPLMMFFGVHVSARRLVMGGGEMIPGINNIPFWTAFVVVSLWQGATTKKARKGILALAGAAVLPTRGIMNIRKDTGQLLGTSKENSTQPLSARQLVRGSEEEILQPQAPHTPLQDIRPVPAFSTPPRAANDNQPYAQAA